MAQRLFPLPDELRFIWLYGVPYSIAWEQMLPGYSVFLKTTATAAMVRKQLRPVEKHFNIHLAAHPRCEFGFYGVRIWRLA